MAYLQDATRPEALGTARASRVRGEHVASLWAVLAAAFCAGFWIAGLSALAAVLGFAISPPVLAVAGIGIIAFLACICIALMKSRE